MLFDEDDGVGAEGHEDAVVDGGVRGGDVVGGTLEGQRHGEGEAAFLVGDDRCAFDVDLYVGAEAFGEGVVEPDVDLAVGVGVALDVEGEATLEGDKGVEW